MHPNETFSISESKALAEIDPFPEKRPLQSPALDAILINQDLRETPSDVWTRSNPWRSRTAVIPALAACAVTLLATALVVVFLHTSSGDKPRSGAGAAPKSSNVNRENARHHSKSGDNQYDRAIGVASPLAAGLPIKCGSAIVPPSVLASGERAELGTSPESAALRRALYENKFNFPGLSTAKHWVELSFPAQPPIYAQRVGPVGFGQYLQFDHDLNLVGEGGCSTVVLVHGGRPAIIDAVSRHGRSVAFQVADASCAHGNSVVVSVNLAYRAAATHVLITLGRQSTRIKSVRFGCREAGQTSVVTVTLPSKITSAILNDAFVPGQEITSSVVK